VQFTPNVLVFLTRGEKREGYERRAQEEGGWLVGMVYGLLRWWVERERMNKMGGGKVILRREWPRCYASSKGPEAEGVKIKEKEDLPRCGFLCYVS